MKFPTPESRRQRGAVLVLGLIFLAMLSLLGVAAYSVATQEERMSGNSRDRVRAIQAAETSLRDCESLLTVASDAALPVFDGNNGMHVARASTASYQVYDDPTFNWKATGGNVRVLPSAAVVGVALQPRCIVERMTIAGTKLGLKPIPEKVVYRITAMGFGTNAGTFAQVQTTYVRP